MKEIDCRGLACPQPVLTTKKALEEIEEGPLRVVVDDLAARDNVERFAKSQGASVSIEQKGNDFYITIDKKGGGSPSSPSKAEKVVIYMNSNLLGVGDETLGSTLIRSFFHVLAEMDPVPSAIIFINSGVRLTTEGSEVLEDLKNLSQKGVSLLSCGTCLDYYGLKEKLKVGVVSNMYDIARTLFEADRLIRP
ncbi:MAG: sulfurtransferase-like selenium metabolism protein YedF [Desulfobacterota bacterium]|nr:sulfurtransferase-like selenium metabolism protein YedF [Thermodesulfobacteriota bacterium]